MAFAAVAIGGALADPAQQAMMIDLTDGENRRFVYALLYWVMNIGVMLGAAIGGWWFKTHLFGFNLRASPLVGSTYPIA